MEFCWATINVRDMEESISFYQNLLGLKVNRRTKMNPDMELAFLGEGDTKIELIWNRGKAPEGFGEGISLGFTVPSIEEFTEKLKERRIAVHSGPFQPNPSIKFIFIQDPNGLRIQLVENIRISTKS